MAAVWSDENLSKTKKKSPLERRITFSEISGLFIAAVSALVSYSESAKKLMRSSDCTPVLKDVLLKGVFIELNGVLFSFKVYLWRFEFRK